MMMRTDFQASGHRSLDMNDFSAHSIANSSADETPSSHPRLSKPMARHDVTVTLLGVVCTLAVFGLLGLLFSLG